MKKILSLFALSLLTISAGAVNDLSQANALQDDENFTFNGNAVVTVCRNNYVFLRDESGFGMISGVQGTFENGQVLNSGWSATKTSNNGWAWFAQASGLSASGETNTALAAAIVPYSIDESLLNAYVCIQNQAPSFFPARKFTLPDGSKIAKTESLWAGNADATTGNYNVYGVIVKIGDELMFNILDYEDYVEPIEIIRGDANGDGIVNISDVTLLINAVLNDDFSTINIANSDMDENEAINVSDVTALIAIVMNN